MTRQNEQLLSSQHYQYVFTVFTATYNRAHTLHRVYDSLKVQTYRDFEWLIVDDGSTDNTYELVEQWQKENQFSIRYIYQENSGKHIAFNRGVKEAKGELFLNLDSDDGCVSQALERHKYHWDAIPEDKKSQFTGVTSLCQDQDGKIVGTKFPFCPTDSDSLEIVYRFKVLGEKWGFHRTDVLREFPFNEEIKQTYLPESLVWNKIARKYKTRFVNEPLRIYWLEKKISLAYGGDPKRNAVGRRIAHLSTLNEEIDWMRFGTWKFFRSAINYSRNSFHLGIPFVEQYQALDTTVGKILWLISLPVGYLVYFSGKSGLLKG